jgi:hypothetical protein
MLMCKQRFTIYVQILINDLSILIKTRIVCYKQILLVC